MALGRVNVGGAGLGSADKAALITIANDAEANNSIIKADVITKLNTKGLSLAAGATWAEIQAQIPNIYIGKKWAFGEATVNITNSQQAVIATGLEFIPKNIFFTLKQNTTVRSSACGMRRQEDGTYVWERFYNNSEAFVVPPSEPTTNSITVRNYAAATLTYVSWIAFE